ncbi:MAG: protein kinase, partial [Pseudomonadota bacterium]
MQGAQTLGNYQLLQSIGRDDLLENFVSISRGPGSRDLTLLRRLAPEVAARREQVPAVLGALRLGLRVAHANILPVLETSQVDDGGFVVTEFVRGATLLELRQLLAADPRPVPPRVAAAIIRDAALALHAVHQTADPEHPERTLQHGAIRPRALWVGLDGTTRVTDLGVSQALLLLAQSAGGAPVPHGYCSPEQLRGELRDPSSDQFSLGVVLWELMVQRTLFTVADPAETAQRVVRHPVDMLVMVLDECPPEIDETVQRMLSRKPHARFRDCASVAATLQGYLDREPGDVKREVAEFVRGVAGPMISARTPVLSSSEATMPGAGTTPRRTAAATTRSVAQQPAPAARAGVVLPSTPTTLPHAVASGPANLGGTLPVETGAVAPLPGEALQAIEPDLRVGPGAPALFCATTPPAPPATQAPAQPTAPLRSSTAAPAATVTTSAGVGPVAVFCSSCGERQHPAARFCHRCGKPAPGETSEPIEIERVMATARDEGSSVQVDRT